jgi:hypothetical protein
MKANLEFNLPEDETEHLAAVKGIDAILCIDDLINEIRSFLKYESGVFKNFETWEGNTVSADAATLERVRELLHEYRQERQIPDLP